MKLVIIGGGAAAKLQSVLQGNADNIDTSIYPTMEAFMNTSTMQGVFADRIFLLQDAYESLDGDKHTALECFSTFLLNNYPDIKLICLGSKEPILQEFSSVFISPDYATFSMSRGSARFLCDCAQKSVDTLTELYSAVLRTNGSTAMPAAQPVAPAPAPVAPAQKEKKTSIFSRKKNTSTDAGQSPAAPLTPSQNASLGQNQDSSGSFSSGAKSSQNTNPFGQQPKANPFGQQPKANPFNRGTQGGASATPAQQPAAKKPNIFNRGAQAAVQQPSAASSEAQPTSNVNPFSGKAANNFNPFANNGQKPQGTTNPFGQTPMQAQAPVQQAPASPANDFESYEEDSFDSTNEQFGGSSFGDVDEVEEVSTSSYDFGGVDEGQFGANTPSLSDFGGSESSNNPFGGSPNAMNTQSDFGSSEFGQDAFGGGNAATNYGPVGRKLPQPDFNSPMGNQNFGTSAFGGGSQQGFPAGTPNPVISRPSQSANSQEPVTPFDKSKLRGKIRNKFDFSRASQVDIPKQEDDDIEEAAFGGQSDYYDDSAYNAQFQQSPKVKVIEREVFVDSGTDIAALKLLEGGKRVVILVTGDRRSGVTSTALTIAEMFAKRYNTLVVDFDNETCGGQLCQDVDALMEEEDNVKYGVKHVKNPKMLRHMVHHDMTSGYDYLFALLGTEPVTVTEAHNTANVLLAQQDYNLVIVDCPWSKLTAMEDLAPNAKILLCVDGSDIGGCYNIVRLLNDVAPSSRLYAALERNAAYIGKHGGSVQTLMTNMKWVAEAFETQGTNWAKLRILGTSDKADLQNILSKF